MIINLAFAETHTGIFLNGVNLGVKLDIRKRHNLLLQYDYKHEMLIIWLNKQLAMVPKETVVAMIALNQDETGYKHPGLEIEQTPPPQTKTADSTILAQVSTPQSHVFENRAGVTGVGQRVK